MPKNVEIKANVEDVKKLKVLAEELSLMEGKLIVQEDTFFLVPNGRLKLREIQDDKAQLIFYKRSDTTSAKLCEFHTTNVSDPKQLKCVLGAALGVRGVLKKQRLLYMVDQTRIHIDQVEGLGEFMELEVVLGESDTVEGGVKIAQDLMDKLGISKTDLIDVAYIDLLLAKTNT
ncbi:hypothetical protein NP493_324g00014 [Ridgeia piscesae]|uniref:CYTH domain-containing protein n=1 Tax=Ridgeia piscesae TaxID=27915 RepID=A0AAD9L553_RIDPI|nr:hypothetical protein NP493_324g00014 [Ridgeia piscesae]